MAEAWSIDGLVSFALALGTLEALDPPTIQELGQGLCGACAGGVAGHPLTRRIR